MRTTGWLTHGFRPFSGRRAKSLVWLSCLAGFLAFAALSGSGRAALASTCDDDGDGFVDCTIPGCDDPTFLCGDCDDGNPDVNPGAGELCDFIDNDCDGEIDEDFPVGRESATSPDNDCNDGEDNDGDGLADANDPECLAAKCFLEDPPGCVPGDPAGCCLTASFLQCEPSGLGVSCPVPLQGPKLHAPEGPAGESSCSDSDDNDCDGLFDFAEPDCQSSEVCDGFDNDGSGRESAGSPEYDCGDGIDNDGDGFLDGADEGCQAGIDDSFPTLGEPCVVGVGACQSPGTLICNSTENGTRCSAVPSAPQSEGPFGSESCGDGIDNDCDGLVDFPNDADCTEAEKCDGLDNDGDGNIDEVFDLGDPCSVGTGACESSGQKICGIDKNGTICNAVPILAATEGPTGATCDDGIDNDCDGLVDDSDPSCGSADISVSCSLPFIRPIRLDGPFGPRRGRRQSRGCIDRHRIVFDVTGAGPDPAVTAELLALDPEGNILGAIPVENGDTALLASRIDPDDFKLVPAKSARARHQVFAPVPMLRVTVDDGLAVARAYCSPLPYLQVVQPSGEVVTEATGDELPVMVAIPRVDPTTLSVKIDGVDILQALGIDPVVDFPGGPFGGPVLIQGQPVTISDLVVESEPVDRLAPNTFTMTVSDLACGGHVVLVDAERREGSFPEPAPAVCLVDDVRDVGAASVFSIEITSPTEGLAGHPVPTPVLGEVCHGREIATVQINGLEVGVSGQIFTPGDGENSADTFVLPFDAVLPATDLVRDLSFGDTPFGTFDPGPNRLIADATDDQGNRTFETLIFATGETQNPGTPFGPGALPDQIDDPRRLDRRGPPGAQTPVAPASAPATEISNAFVVGLTENAVQVFYDNKCPGAGQAFADIVTGNILSESLSFDLLGGFGCDLPISVHLSGVEIDPTQISCLVNLTNGKIGVTVNLPDIVLTGTTSGACETQCLGACSVETVVDISWEATLSSVSTSFDVTENQLKGLLGPPPSPVVIGNSSVTQTGGAISFSCFGTEPDEIPLELLTLEAIDLGPAINVSGDGAFQRALGAVEPDPLRLGEIRIDEAELEPFGQSVQSVIDSVLIDPNGVRAGSNGFFFSGPADPEIEESPGGLLTPAPLPDLPLAGADDITILISDDVFNQLFASMTLQGTLKTGCATSGRTVEDFLPADCDTLGAGTDAGSARAQGFCHGIRGVDCETLGGDTPLLTGIEQGTCHGVKGASCATIEVTGTGLAERDACRLAPMPGIVGSDPLLFCARTDVPPRVLIDDDPATVDVEIVLRLNDLSMALVVDRDSDGLDGELTATPSCYAERSPSVGDCALVAACLDLNFNTSMQLDSTSCSAAKPGFRAAVTEVQTLVRKAGLMCGGANPGDDARAADEAAASPAIDVLIDNIDMFTPPACADGFDLGGIVTFDQPRLISIEPSGGGTFEDYLGITGTIVPSGP